MKRTLLACAAAACSIVIATSVASAQTVRSATGADAASIQSAVDQFRLDLGNPNNGNTPGPLLGGRREINWDGGGATTASPAGNPFSGFLNTRGALFTTPGTGFLQTPLDAPELDAINPTYETTFAVFSAQRIFLPIDSNITDATFFVPGGGGPATVTGFGAVFTDVDLAATTSIEYFDVDGGSLGTFFAPSDGSGSQTLSFLGVTFTDPVVARVRITTGNSALGPTDQNGDLVDVAGLDDFLYGEPQLIVADAIPEPSPATLGAAALAAIAASLARRRPHRSIDLH